MYASSSFATMRPAGALPRSSTVYGVSGGRNSRWARRYRPRPHSPIRGPMRPNFYPSIGGGMCVPHRPHNPNWVPPLQSVFPSFTQEIPICSAFLEDGARMTAIVAEKRATNNKETQASLPVVSPPNVVAHKLVPPPPYDSCRTLPVAAIGGLSKEVDGDLSNLAEDFKLKVEQQKEDVLESEVAARKESSKEMMELYQNEVEKISRQQCHIDSLESCTQQLRAELEEKCQRINFLQDLLNSPVTAQGSAISENGSAFGSTIQCQNDPGRPLISSLDPEIDNTSDFSGDFLESPPTCLFDPMLSDAASQPETPFLEAGAEVSGDVLMAINGADGGCTPKRRSSVADLNLESSFSSLDLSPAKTAIGMLDDGTVEHCLKSRCGSLGDPSNGTDPAPIDRIIDDVIASVVETRVIESALIENNEYLELLTGEKVEDIGWDNCVHIADDVKFVGRNRRKFVGIHDYSRKRLLTCDQSKGVIVRQNVSENFSCSDGGISFLPSDAPAQLLETSAPRDSNVPSAGKGILELMIEKLKSGVNRNSTPTRDPQASPISNPSGGKNVAVLHKSKINPTKQIGQDGWNRGKRRAKMVAHARPFLERNKLQLLRCTVDRSCTGRFGRLAELKAHLLAKHQGGTAVCSKKNCPRYFLCVELLNRHIHCFHRNLRFKKAVFKSHMK